MAKLTRVWAREILDSRGVPTIEVGVMLENGVVAIGSAPSGTSRGANSAHELRDNDETRYKGKGVLKAVENVNTVIGPALISSGIDPLNQFEIDKKLVELDGTEDKSKLGANSLIAASVAIAKAAAATSKTPLYNWIAQLSKQVGIKSEPKLPTPIFNMINGGLHGAGNLDFQEFFVIPASSKPFSEKLRTGVEVYMVIGESLARRGAVHSVGKEGGYAPNLFTNADALEVLVEAIKQTNYQIGRDVFLGLDVAASTFFRNNAYVIRDKTAPMAEDQMIEYYKELNSLYHLAVLEDALHEDAWEGWKKLRQALGDQIAIVGDDLLVTNQKRVQKAIETQACNAILVKPNQTGTISEALQVVKTSRDAGWKVVTSHRSGETNDTFIADFAVGIGSDYVKFGAPARGERVVKYNRLSAIEAELTYAASNAQSQAEQAKPQ